MKYFICIPRGGISDILNVINFCLEYSIKYNRILIIHPNKDSWIQDELIKYIQFDHPSIYNGNVQKKLKELEKMTIFPNEIKDLEICKNKYINGCYHIITTNNNNEDIFINSNINLERDYTEDAIIYCNCEGGIPKNILNYIKINRIVLDVYYTRMSKLDENYISIHIRNTDRKTDDVEGFINSIKNKIDKSNCVFLASDCSKTIEYIKNIYQDKIYTFSKITDNNGKNMHYYYNKDILTNEELVIDCIVDLLMLSSAKEYYFSNPKSSYSRTANYLYSNKDVLDGLLR